MGRLLGLLFISQLASGFILTFYYDNSSCSFIRIWSLHLEVFIGYFLHFTHLNLASIIFFCIYLHLIKAIVFGSYLHIKAVWISGWFLLLITIGVAFIGYVLPWGQIRLWGATVITNLLTAIPLVGIEVAQWLWGGFFVSNTTLKLFFRLHFLLPLVSFVGIFFHIILLHLNGSSNPLGGSEGIIKQEFIVSFAYKDLLNILVIVSFLVIYIFNPYTISDPENFLMANPLVSPIHIQPEWYFLPYYAILRAIPRKTGGVVCFIISLILILILVFRESYQSIQIYKIWYIYFIIFLRISISLTYLGSCPVQTPYFLLAQASSLLYFIWFLFFFIIFIYFFNSKFITFYVFKFKHVKFRL